MSDVSVFHDVHNDMVHSKVVTCTHTYMLHLIHIFFGAYSCYLHQSEACLCPPTFGTDRTASNIHVLAIF